ncbi:hypothetical protein AB0C74_33480 [Spirillospora sp. NPDC048832]
MDATEPALRWFPLVARARPACTPLNTRVAALCTLAESAARSNDQAAASTVHNQAALLASDVGMPTLARALCHRHADIYLRACPLDARAARRALEPLVNLARLHIRDGNGDRAFRLLDALYEAVTSGTDIVVGDLPVPVSTLVASPDERQELRRWLWSVHLADGTRALTSASQWQEALLHLRRHRGIGNRMLDGRQVAVIAHLTAGATEEAMRLLASTTAGEPWEEAVAAFLIALCRRRAGQPIAESTATLIHRQERLHLPPNLVVFRTRLGLALIDAANCNEIRTIRSAIVNLAQQAVSSRDGHAARDILERGHLLSKRQERQLRELLDLSGLGQGSMPLDLQARLNTAVTTAESALIENHGLSRDSQQSPTVSVGADPLQTRFSS